MPVLKDILYKSSLQTTSGRMDLEINEIVFDSRQVKAGCAFVAVRGTQSDGHQFIEMAIEQGAAAIICENIPASTREDITYVQVENSARALGIMASNFYQNPSNQLTLIGVTGTNGKTTTATLLFQLFRNLGYNSGLLSTVENKINEAVISASHTTPDPVQLNQLMSKMVQEGCTHCFMEVSSHAIHQERIAGLDFNVAIFTNITHDHLDYHITFENYVAAKKKFFDDLPAKAFALVNNDDRRGKVMLQNTRAIKKSMGIKSMADYRARIISNTLEGLELEISGQNIWFKMIGDFNAYNLLTAYATAMLLDEDENEVLTQLSALPGAVGRFEKVPNPGNVIAIVDYAHTPDALKNVLETINKVKMGKEQVITIVGCGGNRDRQKRPEMAKIACNLSDKVVFTSDNPRDEEPAAIIDEMMTGVGPTQQKKVLSITERKEAIKTACTLASGGDIILLAGKGHETYQEIKGVKYPFDDRKILAEMLDLIFKKE